MARLGAFSPYLLEILAAEGIRPDVQQWETIAQALSAEDPWPPERLAGVLSVILARSAEQQARLHARLLAALGAPAAGRDAAVEQAQYAVRGAEGRKRPPAEPPAADKEGKPADEERGEKRAARLWLLTGCAAFAASAAALLSAIFRTTREAPVNPAPAPAGLTEVAPTVRNFVSATLEQWLQSWQDTAILVISLVSLMFGILAMWLYLEQRRRFRRERAEAPAGAPAALPAGPVRFRTEAIGGPPAPVFGRVAGRAVARAVPRRPGQTASPWLDLLASVRRTALNGGIPSLLHHPLREVVPVMVVADRLSLARRWSRFPQELAGTLAAAGVHAELAWFQGELSRIEIDGRAPIEGAELGDVDGLILFVGDGALLRAADGPTGHADAMLLRRLAAGRNVAWLDDREPRFWDPRVDVQHRISGLPVFPASVAGTVDALRFLGGQDRRPPPPPVRPVRPADVSDSGVAIATQVRTVLAEAMPWAEACAMFQPVGPGLADALRRRFFPDLPSEAFRRMAVLPGTGVGAVGLTFSRPVLALLRAGFADHFSQRRQDEILSFLRRLVEEVRPGPGSVAYEDWQWRYARLVLDHKPDDALGDLLDLRGSHMEGAMRRDLAAAALRPIANRVAENDAPPSSWLVPLRAVPTDTARFIDLANSLGIEPAGPNLVVWHTNAMPAATIEVPRGGLIAATAAAARRFAVLDRGGLVNVWDRWDGGDPVFRIEVSARLGEEAEDTRRSHLALSPDGAALAVAPSGQMLSVHSLLSKEPATVTDAYDDTLARVKGGVTALQWSRTGNVLAAASATEGVVLLELVQGKVGRSGFFAGNWAVGAVAFDSGTKLVAIGNEVGEVQIFEVGVVFSATNGQSRSSVRFALGGRRAVDALAFGQGGRLAVAADGWLIVRMEDGRELGPHPIPKQVRHLELTGDDDGVAVVISSDDAQPIRLIQVDTGLSVLVLPEALSGPGRFQVAAVSLEYSQILAWGQDRLSMTVHPLRRDGGTPAEHPTS